MYQLHVEKVRKKLDSIKGMKIWEPKKGGVKVERDLASEQGKRTDGKPGNRGRGGGKGTFGGAASKGRAGKRRECGKKRGERTAGKSKKREAKWEGGARRDSSGLWPATPVTVESGGLWPATPVADSAEKGRRRGRGRLGRQNAQASNFQAN